jgi:hypothetical protein
LIDLKDYMEKQGFYDPNNLRVDFNLITQNDNEQVNIISETISSDTG